MNTPPARTMVASLATLFVSRATGVLLRTIVATCLLLLLLQIALGLSGQQRVQSFMGPFVAEVEGSAAFAVRLNADFPMRYILGTGGDTSDHPFRSNSTVTANGVALGPAHAVHDDIRSGASGAGAFSHWNEQVIFSLPEGMKNSGATVLSVAYGWSLRDEFLDLVGVTLACSLALIALRLGTFYPGAYNVLALRNVRVFIGASVVAWTMALATAVLYLASIAIGFVDGWYLPNTAIFSYIPWTRQLATLEPYAAHVVLYYALLGVVLTWLSPKGSEATSAMKDYEERWIGHFGRYGLVVLIGLFLFSIGATWAGIPRTQDLSGNAIAGLVPFNDATGHFAETFHSATEGAWNDFASRRPLAAALRSMGMLVAGHYNTVFLAFQTVLLAISTYIATRSVMRWRGFWAGSTFLGLSIVLVRPYLPSNLTEPIGILLAMASIPYIVRALAGGSLAAKGTGLFLTSTSLSVRMGNMFAIPAIGLWMLLTSEPSLRGRLKTLAVFFGSLLVVGALTWSLSQAYGSKQGAVGSNFAYVFCGLTHNGNWTTCEGIYAAELAEAGGNEAARAQILYAYGLENLIHKPIMLIGRLAHNVSELIESMPSILLRGYTGELPGTFLTLSWFFVAALGLGRFVGSGGMARSEKIFWGLFGLSLVGAASIIFADDGLRVMSVSYPVLFLLVSTGFASRTTSTPFDDAPRSLRLGRSASWGLMSIFVVGAFVAPWVTFHWDLVGARALAAEKSPPEEVYLSSRYMSGFLVVADDLQNRKDVPTIGLSNFRQIITNSHIEQYGKIDTPEPPFAVVAAPGLVANGGALLIIPENMFVDRSVFGWNVTYSGGTSFRLVDKATPISTRP
tara:strand:+ start:21729 stop:24281 length:2553 start_codon:yes stop_codon:yes gene_type:complete